MYPNSNGNRETKMAKYQIELDVDEAPIVVSSMEKAKYEIEQFCQHGIEQSVATMRKEFKKWGHVRVNLCGSNQHYFHIFAA